MRVKARRVGNSITVTIPKEVASALAIEQDTVLDVSVKADLVILAPVASPWERLVAQARAQTAGMGLTESDVDETLAELRGRKRR